MFDYKETPSGSKLHNSDKFVNFICGPYGSGKSCATAVDILARACRQAAAPDGVRYTRVGVVRATYPELISMTRRSLQEVLPSECGRITAGTIPLKGFYLIPLPDGTTVHLELELFSAQDSEDVAKLLSANWSFAWMNEATGMSEEVFQAVLNRIGRYPSNDNGGVSWGGLLLDFNKPALGSWLDNYIKNPEPNWAYIEQPPAAFKKYTENGDPYYEVNDNAENLYNLGAWEEGDPDLGTLNDDEMVEYQHKRGKRYYQNQINALLKAGRVDVVDNMYCMIDTPIIEGKPVYTNFNYDRHVSKVPLESIQGVDVIVGLDQSGHHPAAVVMQNQHGKWCILDELYADNEGFENFLQGMLLPLLRSHYANCPVIAAIDPSNQRDTWQAITPRARLEEVGIPVVSDVSNNPKLRIQQVEAMLNREVGGLLVSVSCELVVRGFMSEYRYRRLRASGTLGAAYTPQPEKNEASHLQDAIQYAALLIARGADMEKSADAVAHIADSLSTKRRILRSVV